MTEVSLTSGHEQHPGSPGQAGGRPLTLAEQHMLLLWPVTARSGKLLAETAHARRPAAELTSLTGYTQAEVLRQASDEEALLFPAAPSDEVTVLARDHVRLRSAAELLVRAAAGQQPMSPALVAVAVRDFVARLERHLRAEEELLASRHTPRGVPGIVAPGGQSREWYRSPRDP